MNSEVQLFLDVGTLDRQTLTEIANIIATNGVNHDAELLLKILKKIKYWVEESTKIAKTYDKELRNILKSDFKETNET